MHLIPLYYHIVRADLLERTRRYSFLVSLLIIIYIGYAVNTGLIRFVTSGARSAMNSAWIGLQMGLVVSTFVSLVGFYLVKNCIDRDERTGVGQIIATTPITSLQYLAGKWLSNLIVLALIVLILGLATVLMQLLQTSVDPFDAWALLSPLLLIGLPMMSMTAGLAVFFESFAVLRSGAGNIIYFICWAFGLIGSLQFIGPFVPALEPFGMSLAVNSLTPAIRAVVPGYTFQGGFYLGPNAQLAAQAVTRVFEWQGVVWTPGLLIGRLVIFLVPLLLVAGAALYFGRFDPAYAWRGLRRSTREPDLPLVPEEAAPAAARSTLLAAPPLSMGEKVLYRPAFGSLVWQNIRLIVKGFPQWYYLVLALLWLACLIGPPATDSTWLAVLSVFATLSWSRCGAREARSHTSDLTFCAPHPLGRLLLAEWLALLGLTMLLFSGMALNLALHGASISLLGLGVGALLIPSAALALGVWSGTSKVFEASYVIIWYLGIANHAPRLDYLGTTSQAFVQQAPLPAALLALLFLAAAFLGRKRVIV